MPTIPQTFKEEGRFENNPNDVFITPIELIRGVLQFDLFDFFFPDTVLDPGCGTGQFGRAVKEKWPKTHITGMDISINDVDFYYNETYDRLIIGDYLKPEIDTFGKFDLIIGNPPFSSETDKRLAEKFVHKSMSLLAPNGILCFLLKTEFVASNVRFEHLFKKYRPRYIIQSVDRVSFSGDGKTNTIEYGFFLWCRPQVSYTNFQWMKWNNVERVEFL